jgi:hypothetical protein
MCLCVCVCVCVCARMSVYVKMILKIKSITFSTNVEKSNTKITKYVQRFDKGIFSSCWKPLCIYLYYLRSEGKMIVLVMTQLFFLSLLIKFCVNH